MNGSKMKTKKKKTKKGGTRTIISSTTPRRGLGSGLQHVPEEKKNKKPPKKAAETNTPEKLAESAGKPASAAPVKSAPAAGGNRAPAGDVKVNRETGEITEHEAARFDGAKVFIPTNIGIVCEPSGESRLEHQVVYIHPDDRPDGCILTATDGRMMALVAAELNVDVEGKHPQSIPRHLAKPGRDGARELRSVVGPEANLFGDVRVWVDMTDMRYAVVPPPTTPYPFADILPSVHMGWRMIGINTEKLAQLAKAINSQESPVGVAGVTLAIPPEGMAGPIVVVGDVGAGVLMPIACNAEMDTTKYNQIRRRAIAAGKRVVHTEEAKPLQQASLPMGGLTAPEANESSGFKKEPPKADRLSDHIPFRAGVTGETTLASLTSIPSKVREAMQEAGIFTVSQLEDRQGRISALSGVGPAGEAAIEDAVYQMKPEPPTQPEEPALSTVNDD